MGSNVSYYIISIVSLAIQVQTMEVEEDLIVQGLEKRSTRGDKRQKGRK